MGVGRIQLRRIDRFLIAVPVVCHVGLAKGLFAIANARIRSLAARLIRQWMLGILDERWKDTRCPPE